MIPPTLGLDIDIKGTHYQTLAGQDKERQGDETCKRYAPCSCRIHRHLHVQVLYTGWHTLMRTPRLTTAVLYENLSDDQRRHATREQKN